MSLTIFKRTLRRAGARRWEGGNGPFAAETCEIRPDFARLAVENDGEMPTKGAALYFPGAPAVGDTGTYDAPELVAQRIDQRQYRDAYADIGPASRPEGRCFVMDLHADGHMRIAIARRHSTSFTGTGQTKPYMTGTGSGSNHAVGVFRAIRVG